MSETTTGTAAPPQGRAWTKTDIAQYLVCAESTVDDIIREDQAFPAARRPRPGLARWVPAEVIAWFEGTEAAATPVSAPLAPAPVAQRRRGARGG